MPLVMALRRRQADLWAQMQPRLYSELQYSQGDVKRPCLKSKQNFVCVKIKPIILPGMVAYTCNSNTREAETGALAQVWGQTASYNKVPPPPAWVT